MAEKVEDKASTEEAKKAADTKALADKKTADDKAASDLSKSSSVKKELDRVRNKTERTQREKLLYTKNRIDEQLRDLDKEEGVETVLDEDDAAPVTVGMLKKRDQDKAISTAKVMANDIEDEDERDLVKHHLENTIRPSGNPQEDLKNARALVNSVKNSQVVEELARKQTARSTASGSSAPGRHEEAFEPTADERKFMLPPFNLKKDDIIRARTQSQDK